jgi:6-phosphogluconate dehydrogenase
VELLHGFDEELDLPAIFAHWNHGTVVRSWLVELMGNALATGGIGPAATVAGDLSELSMVAEDTDEVQWVARWAAERDISTPVTAVAQQLLTAYRDVDLPAAKAVALLRNQFGERPVHGPDEGPHRR